MTVWDRAKQVAGSWAAGAVLIVAWPASGLAAEGAGPADKPAAPEIKPEQVAGGLQVTLVMRERTFRAPGGGDNAAERKVKLPTIQLKNVGDKPLVLDFQLPGGGGFGGRGMFGAPGGAEAGPVKVSAKDADGKDLPRPEPPRANRDAQPKPEERPVTFTLLKPGQVLEGPLTGPG